MYAVQLRSYNFNNTNKKTSRWLLVLAESFPEKSKLEIFSQYFYCMTVYVKDAVAVYHGVSPNKLYFNQLWIFFTERTGSHGFCKYGSHVTLIMFLIKRIHGMQRLDFLRHTLQRWTISTAVRNLSRSALIAVNFSIRIRP